MASILKLPEPKCEIMIKSIIHILKAHGMLYSKQPKNIKISHICHFGLIEGKSLRLAIVRVERIRVADQQLDNAFSAKEAGILKRCPAIIVFGIQLNVEFSRVLNKHISYF